ncbi:MAG: hypothetical protein ACKO2V_09085 [Snowella sp.]
MTPRPAWNKAIAAWILYDSGSSGYIFLIPGIAYAIFFREQVCGGGANCDGQWGLLVSLTLLISGLLAPLLGAIARPDSVNVIPSPVCCIFLINSREYI